MYGSAFNYLSARTQAGQLQNQLIEEQRASKWLRGQLDRAHKELQVCECVCGVERERKEKDIYRMKIKVIVLL